MNKLEQIEQKLLEAITSKCRDPHFSDIAFNRVRHGGLFGNRHIVDSVNYIKVWVHPLGCVSRLTADVGVQIPDENKRGEGKLVYKFSVATRKYSVTVKVKGSRGG